MRNQTTSISPSMPPQIQAIASTLRLTGWLGFWLQFLLAVSSAIILVFSIFSRNIDTDTANAGTGFSVFLAFCGMLALCFTAFLSFRYTRFSRRLHNPNPAKHPSRETTTQVVRLALLVSLGGLGVVLLGADIGISVLLAKLLVQPQGVAIYNPNKVIRVLDVLVILGNATVALGHFAGTVISLYLLNRLT